MTRSDAVKFVALRSIGNFLVLFSLYGVLATFGPAVTYEVKFRIAQARGVTYHISDATASQAPSTPATPVNTSLGEVLVGNTNQAITPPDKDFSIIIPKIGASSKVFPNVDPTNEVEFHEKLAEGVAHAKGTVFPGIKGTTYLFAHSTDNWWNVGRYNAVFYLLKELSKGDDVVVFFEGKRHNYTVVDTMITDPEDVSLLTNSRGNEELLVLQTCWPPGTTWKRLFVIAKPVVSL